MSAWPSWQGSHWGTRGRLDEREQRPGGHAHDVGGLLESIPCARVAGTHWLAIDRADHAFTTKGVHAMTFITTDDTVMCCCIVMCCIIGGCGRSSRSVILLGVAE